MMLSADEKIPAQIKWLVCTIQALQTLHEKAVGLQCREKKERKISFSSAARGGGSFN
jgi:hypothetical protein